MDNQKIDIQEKKEEKTTETKPKKRLGKVKRFLSRHKTKIIGAAVMATGITAGVMWKRRRDRRNAEEEEQRNELAEEWFQRGLERGSSSEEGSESSDESEE